MLTGSQAEWTSSQREDGIVELTIELTPITDLKFAAAICATSAQQNLICDRCESPNELIVAVMEIAAIDTSLALCGLCVRELPAGFEVA
jgi:hypothetical protein